MLKQGFFGRLITALNGLHKLYLWAVLLATTLAFFTVSGHYAACAYSADHERRFW